MEYNFEAKITLKVECKGYMNKIKKIFRKAGIKRYRCFDNVKLKYIFIFFRKRIL